MTNYVIVFVLFIFFKQTNQINQAFMKLAINQATLLKTPMVQFLEVSSEAGFEGVELRRDETFLYLKNHSPHDLKSLLDQHDLKCVSFNAIELFSLCPEEEFANIQKYTKKLMKIGNIIGCDLIIAVPSFLDDRSFSLAEIKEQTIERLIILKRLAEQHNFKLAFEPLGFPNCSVRDLSLALEILNNENLVEMGLVIDTFHFFVGGNSIDSLNSLSPHQLWLVHINDVNFNPDLDMKDSDRVLPGDGTLNLKDFMNTLKSLGYNQWISIELFNESLWKEDPIKVAQKSMKSLKNILPR